MATTHNKNKQQDAKNIAEISGVPRNFVWGGSYHIISFISVDPYRIRNPYGYGKWSHNHRVYKTIKTIFVSLAPYKLFDVLR